jgi:hypothetical protein
LDIGAQALDLPTLVAVLEQTPELLAGWWKTPRNWKEIQKALTVQHPKTGEIVTIDVLPFETLEPIKLPITGVRKNGTSYTQDVVIAPPSTVLKSPNGGVGNAYKKGWDVKVKPTAEYEASAIGSIAKTTNQLEAQLKLTFAKIFGRSKFIEAILKNLPGMAIGGNLNNSVVRALHFVANTGFYAKMIKPVLQERKAIKKTGGRAAEGGMVAASDAAVSHWKWNTSMKGGSGVLFSPLSTWINGHHYAAKELTLRKNKTGSSGSLKALQSASAPSLHSEWNDTIEHIISSGTGIPQDQMCSLFHWEKARRTKLPGDAAVTWQLGQVGWAVGLPVEEYLKYRGGTQTPYYDPANPSYYFSDSYQDDVNAAMKRDILTLEDNPEASVDLPISYAIRTGEMGVPFHGTLVGSNALMDNIHGMTNPGICWSKKEQKKRGWGYYEKDDGGLFDWDIELHSQDACYACWPGHFPEAFCKGTVNDDGNWPCENNLEADTGVWPFNDTQTAPRYPGLTKQFRLAQGMQSHVTKTVFAGEYTLEPMEGSDFTPVFR